MTNHARVMSYVTVMVAMLVVVGCDLQVNVDTEQTDGGTKTVVEWDGGQSDASESYYQLENAHTGPPKRRSESSSYELTGGVVGAGATRSSSATYELKGHARPTGKN